MGNVGGPYLPKVLRYHNRSMVAIPKLNQEDLVKLFMLSVNVAIEKSFPPDDTSFDTIPQGGDTCQPMGAVDPRKQLPRTVRRCSHSLAEDVVGTMYFMVWLQW